MVEVWQVPSRNTAVDAVVALPGSKSRHQPGAGAGRARRRRGWLRRPLRSRDTVLMAAGAARAGGRSTTRDGDDWLVTPARAARPRHVDVGLAGTVIRFLPPVAALADRAGPLRRRPAGCASAQRRPDRRACARWASRSTTAAAAGCRSPCTAPARCAAGAVAVDASRVQPVRLRAAAGRGPRSTEGLDRAPRGRPRAVDAAHAR